MFKHINPVCEVAVIPFPIQYKTYTYAKKFMVCAEFPVALSYAFAQSGNPLHTGMWIASQLNLNKSYITTGILV